MGKNKKYRKQKEFGRGMDWVKIRDGRIIEKLLL